jgi:hypothetical protein
VTAGKEEAAESLLSALLANKNLTEDNGLIIIHSQYMTQRNNISYHNNYSWKFQGYLHTLNQEYLTKVQHYNSDIVWIIVNSTR